MSLFPRVFASEFAPVFRLMDDYASHVASRGSFGPSFPRALRSFQPRFDVKESKEAYELQGELPGIDQKDLNIEFTDANTLSIKGRTDRSREEGTRPAAIEARPEPAKIAEGSDSASETSSYHKASVEDEATASGANPDATPAETPATEPTEKQVTQQSKPEGPTYWVSERSVGQFARSFSFPQRVDQDAVKASLRNGILSVVVPKASAPVSRRINIE